MPRVFVVHNPNTVNAVGRLQRKYDLSDARRFGELVDVMQAQDNPFHEGGADRLVTKMHAALYDYQSEDYLLLIGSPVFIGMCVAIAADVTDGRVNLLQWNGTRRAYIPVVVNDLFKVGTDGDTT